MKHISIISSSIRIGRKSHRVALYFQKYLLENNLATVEIIDLKEFSFPIFTERLKYQENPAQNVLDFASKIKSSNGIIIVTPEYNGGYPASLKNIIDLLYEEWDHKPVGISTVSKGNFGGSQAIISLQFSLWKMKAWTISSTYPVPNVSEIFNEFGIPKNKVESDKLTNMFIKELCLCMDAK
jgi:NAD(P)H-dependent FMN reductase